MISYRNILFLILASTSLNLFAKDLVLLAFNNQGITGVTSQIVIKGIRAAYNQSVLKDKLDLEEVNFDETLDDIKKKLEKKIESRMPVLIIGAVSSNQAFLINIISKKYSIPFLTPFATHPEVTKQNPYAFRACFDDLFQASRLADFIYSNQKLRRGIVLYNSKQSYAIGIKNAFQESFLNKSNSYLSSFPFTSVDDLKIRLRLEIQKVKPKFILLPSYQSEAASIFLFLSENFKEIKVFGTDSWGGGRLFHSALSENPVSVTGFYVQHWSPDLKSIKIKNFIELAMRDNFLKNHNSAAMLAPAAIGYDSFNIFESAYLINPKNISQAFRSLSLEGVTGKIEFKGQQTPHKELFIYKITNNGDEFYEAFK